MYITFDCGKNSYKCKLSTRSLVDMERALGENPINIFVQMSESKLPKIDVLLTMLWYSMQDLNHGIKRSDIYDIFDEYINNGGTIMTLTDFLGNLFYESGIIGKEEEAQSDDNQEERKN